ncbi:MAG: uroporphyrinogen-III synthase [Deltaproteobacteria bacterium]|nr:uroporphyrinogen-III synthase [Deltaproteobacteria bacterium]
MRSRPAVVLTREAADNEALADALERRAVPVRQIPCVATRYRDPDPAELLELGAIPEIGAVAFTSRHAARGWARWEGSPDPGEAIVAAVGRATAAELESLGLLPTLIADPPRGAALAALLADRVERGAVVVSVGGEKRAGGLEKGLRDAFIEVRSLTVYANDAPDVPSLEPFPVAAVFVASPSAAGRLVAAMPWMIECAFVSIGPTTTAALEDLGAKRIEEPGPDPEHWLSALAAATVEKEP